MEMVDQIHDHHVSIQDSNNLNQIKAEPSRLQPLEVNNIMSEINLISIICILSSLGALARYSLLLLLSSKEFSVLPIFIPNYIGSIMLSIFIRLNSRLKNFHPHLFEGLSIGFCGSFTSFSSWQVSALQSFLGLNYLTESFGFRFLNYMTILIFGVIIPLQAFNSSNHIVALFADNNNGLETDYMLIYSDKTIFLIKLLLYILLLTLLKVYFNIGLYIVIFAPLGALIRWKIGSYLAGVLFIYRYLSSNIYGSWQTIYCEIFEALISGLCGSLTTVSTFVKEISIMSREGKHLDAYTYVLISILLSQLGLGIISIVFFNLFNNNFPNITLSEVNFYAGFAALRCYANAYKLRY